VPARTIVPFEFVIKLPINQSRNRFCSPDGIRGAVENIDCGASAPDSGLRPTSGLRKAVDGRSVPARTKVPLEFVVKLPINQNVQHQRRFIRTIAPRVIGAALDDDIAFLKHDILIIQQHGDLAL